MNTHNYPLDAFNLDFSSFAADIGSLFEAATATGSPAKGITVSSPEKTYQMQVLEVSTHAHGLSAAKLPDLANPVEWYKTFNTSLIGVRSDLSYWNQTILYELTNIPASTLKDAKLIADKLAAARDMAVTLQARPNDALLKQEIATELGIVAGSFGRKASSVASLLAEITKFQAKCVGHEKILTDIATNALASQAKYKDEAAQLTTLIEGLQREVTAAGLSIAAGVGVTGLGVVIGVVGVVGAFFTGGLTLLLLVPAVVVVAGGVTVIALSAVRLKDLQEQIRIMSERHPTLVNDAVYLGVLANQMKRFTDQTQGLQATLTAIKQQWSSMTAMTAKASEAINSASSTQDWKALEKGLDSALSGWSSIVALADKLKLVTVTTSEKLIPVGATSAEIKASVADASNLGLMAILA